MEALLDIDQIIVNKQPVQGDHIEDFVDLLENGRRVPPIVVRTTKTGYVLVDGRHRLAAHKILGRTKIWARLTL